MANKYTGMSHEQLMQSIFTVKIGKDCRQLHRALRKTERKMGIPIWERQGICFEARYPKLSFCLFALMLFALVVLIFVIFKLINL